MVLSGITPPMEGRQIEHGEICKKAEITLFAFDQARRQEAFLRRKQIA